MPFPKPFVSAFRQTSLKIHYSTFEEVSRIAVYCMYVYEIPNNPGETFSILAHSKIHSICM